MTERDTSPIDRLILNNIYLAKGLSHGYWITKEPLNTQEWEKWNGSCNYPNGTRLPDGIFSNSHPDGYIRMVTESKWAKVVIPQPDGSYKKATPELILEENQQLKQGGRRCGMILLDL